ncbi:FAD-binding oxidoreductase [Salinarimonas soli]|uniref:Oxidoreductase n=1 Tax=Salinarimonas soli TaxID=1638099 RepID=A0A5B2VWB6_9HYPH|nr:FAD-binding oxidoreductase [Salinarimonas soli]KAA2242349.1 oxidoreductase [Salinarimonas soli]
MDAPEEAAHVAWQTATIEALTPLSARVKSIVLRPERWRPFQAGQHLDIRLTAPDGYAAQRSYSVASAPETEGVYELAVERLEDGEVSPYLLDIAEPGDAVDIRGPFGGHFVWDAADGGPLLLVGGGSGVAPLMSILRHRVAARSAVPACLVHAARLWDDVLFRGELLALDEDDAAFRLLAALSRDTPRRPQDTGRRIDAALLADAITGLGARPRLTFVCGANPFVESVTTLLVGLGLDPASIRTERFGG